ncbi:hypothetical protein ACVI1J_001899 [Bradyrhizobium diazoefficiens]
MSPDDALHRLANHEGPDLACGHPSRRPLSQAPQDEGVLRATRYSGLMSAAFTIGHHFSVSAFWKAASAAGDCWSRGGISCPNSPKRCLTEASASTATMAALSFVMMSFGVFFGAQMPCQ